MQDIPHCQRLNEKSICIECQNGYFLHESKCLTHCPEGFKANKINFKCVENNCNYYFLFFYLHLKIILSILIYNLFNKCLILFI